jgi:hypothetical protein
VRFPTRAVCRHRSRSSSFSRPAVASCAGPVRSARPGFFRPLRASPAPPAGLVPSRRHPWDFSPLQRPVHVLSRTPLGSPCPSFPSPGTSCRTGSRGNRPRPPFAGRVRGSAYFTRRRRDPRLTASTCSVLGAGSFTGCRRIGRVAPVASTCTPDLRTAFLSVGHRRSHQHRCRALALVTAPAATTEVVRPFDRACARWDPRVGAQDVCVVPGRVFTAIRGSHLSWGSALQGPDTEDLALDFASRSPHALGRTARAVAGASGSRSIFAAAALPAFAFRTASPSWVSYPRVATWCCGPRPGRAHGFAVGVRSALPPRHPPRTARLAPGGGRVLGPSLQSASTLAGLADLGRPSLRLSGHR